MDATTCLALGEDTSSDRYHSKSCLSGSCRLETIPFCLRNTSSLGTNLDLRKHSRALKSLGYIASGTCIAPMGTLSLNRASNTQGMGVGV